MAPSDNGEDSRGTAVSCRHAAEDTRARSRPALRTKTRADPRNAGRRFALCAGSLARLVVVYLRRHAIAYGVVASEGDGRALAGRDVGGANEVGRPVLGT
jgi:hypothetical protein